MPRGALIVLEGVDKAGKSTQCKKLSNTLPNTVLLNFPNRTTQIGQIINQYLKNEIELTDQAVHLLFSANRWEAEKHILDTLNSGKNIIIDRYAYSGVAFTASKNIKNMDLNWCKNSDIGLPKPDKVFYLTLDETDMKNRGDFGAERYEKTDFQKKVAENFRILSGEEGEDGSWEVVDAGRSIEEVNAVLLKSCEEIIKDCGDREILKLWV